MLFGAQVLDSAPMCTSGYPCGVLLEHHEGMSSAQWFPFIALHPPGPSVKDCWAKPTIRGVSTSWARLELRRGACSRRGLREVSSKATIGDGQPLPPILQLKMP